MMKRASRLIMLCCLIAVLAACSFSPEEAIDPEPTIGLQENATVSQMLPAAKITLKLAHQNDENTPEGIAIQHFADEVEKQTYGAVQILVYPNEQLGVPTKVFEGASLGTLGIAVVPCGQLGLYNKYFDVESISFLFENYDSYQAILQEIGMADSEQRTLRDNNLCLLNTERNFFRGPYRVLVSRSPVRGIEDINGLRLRVYESSVYTQCWKALGAETTFVPWNETYMALMQGKVDAVTGWITDIPAMQFCDIAKYVTITNEYHSEVIMVMNQDRFSDLPKEYQDILVNCANEAGAFLTETIEMSLEQELSDLRASGVEILEIDTEPFREKLTEIYRELERKSILPEGTIDLLENSQ